MPAKYSASLAASGPSWAPNSGNLSSSLSLSCMPPRAESGGPGQPLCKPSGFWWSPGNTPLLVHAYACARRLARGCVRWVRAAARFLTPTREKWLSPAWVVYVSAESPAHVVRGFLLGRMLEDLPGLAVLDEPTAVEEDGAVGHPVGLRQVVRNDDDGDLRRQLLDQILDGLGGHRVERRGRLVEQQHVGTDRQRPGQAEQLLLAAGQPERGVLEAVRDRIPESDLGQALVS